VGEHGGRHQPGTPPDGTPRHRAGGAGHADPAARAPGRRARPRRALLVAAGVVLALGVGGSLVLLLRDAPVTVDGRDVVEPGAVLATAADHLDRYVRGRNGARGEDTRCWFHLQDAGGSDVRDALVCGPALFVDGDPERSWLRFGVTVVREDGDVRLTVADEPVSP
jgi:hypothetical protein